MTLRGDLIGVTPTSVSTQRRHLPCLLVINNLLMDDVNSRLPILSHYFPNPYGQGVAVLLGAGRVQRGPKGRSSIWSLNPAIGVAFN